MYHLPAHHLNGFNAYGADDYSEPMGLQLPPIAGYGAMARAASGYHGLGNPAVPTVQATPPSPPTGGPVPMQGQPVQLGKGTAIIVGGLVCAFLGVVGYFAYQELQLRKQIVEKGGGEALMKYELGRAAGTVASGLFAPSATPNRRKRSRSPKIGKKRSFKSNPAYNKSSGKYVVLEYMPRYHRGSHRAAGNWGSWPGNGSERVEIRRYDALAEIESDEDGYARIIKGAPLGQYERVDEISE